MGRNKTYVTSINHEYLIVKIDGNNAHIKHMKRMSLSIVLLLFWFCY